MLHFTLDVFDIEPEVEEKIKGLVEKNNKEYKERNHKWNFEENLGFFNINCHTSSSYYLTELKTSFSTKFKKINILWRLTLAKRS